MGPEVLVPLPDGRWLALDRDQLDRAIHRGAQLMAAQPIGQAASIDVEEELLDADGAAVVLGVSRATVLRQAKVGSLPCRRVGRYVRFRRAELLNHLPANGLAIREGS